MKCDEIFAALAMLEKERGISQTFMMDKIVQALTTAYKRDHEGVENVIVDVDEAEARPEDVSCRRRSSKRSRTPARRCPSRTRRSISAKYEVGGIVQSSRSITSSSAASPPATASRSSSRACARPSSGMVYDEYNSKQHEILTGVVTRIDPRNGNVALRIGTGSGGDRRHLDRRTSRSSGETLVEGQLHQGLSGGGAPPAPAARRS